MISRLEEPIFSGPDVFISDRLGKELATHEAHQIAVFTGRILERAYVGFYKAFRTFLDSYRGPHEGTEPAEGPQTVLPMITCHLPR